MINITTFANNLKRSIVNFSDSISKGITVPKSKFVRDMVFGILISQSIQLAPIGRALKENIDIKKTSERLSRNLENFDDYDIVLENNALKYKGKVKELTPIIIDNTDIVKPNSKCMEGLHKVWDGSKKDATVEGYNICEAAIFNYDTNLAIPIYTDLYTPAEKGFTSENAKLFKCIDFLEKVYGKNGIHTMDRGMDSSKIFEHLSSKNLKFSIRLKKNRNLIYKDKTYTVDALADRYKGMYATKFKAKNGKKRKVYYTAIPVSLPCMPDVVYYLVVVNGYSKNKLMFLCNLEELEPTKQNIFSFILSYISRWNIEEIFRYKKQIFKLESICVRSLKRIRNANLFVMLAASYIAFISNSINSKSMYSVLFLQAKREKNKIYPFSYYAIADGIRNCLIILKSNLKSYMPLTNYSKPSFYQLTLDDLFAVS